MKPAQSSAWRDRWLTAHFSVLPLLSLLSLLLLTSFVLWPGMDGPLVHDDHRNLAPFFVEQPDYRAAVLENDAGPLGRVITMASFALNRLIDSQMAVKKLKISNLFLHLLNGLLVYLLISRLLLTRCEEVSVATISLAATAIWLLNPVNTETVFYIIQRATLLATTFMLMACLVYIRIRTANDDKSLVTSPGMLICLLCWLCALFSKENAILLPLVLLLIEFYLLNDLQIATIKKLSIYVALPFLIIVFLLLQNTGYLDYSGLSFSLIERLSTQPLVVLSYIRESLLPLGIETGLFRDDFVVRQGPWNLPTFTTLVLFVGLLVYGVRNLRTKPALVSFAILFFFCGHLLESTIFPLEIYYRHRNYFPSIGLCLVAVLIFHGFSGRPLKAVLQGIILFVYCLFLGHASYSQARIWSSYDAILLNSYERHPGSVRLSLELTGRLLRQGDVDTALKINGAIINAHPIKGLPAKIQRFYIYCEQARQVSDGEYEILNRDLNLYHPHLISNALGLFIESYSDRRCENVDLQKIVSAFKDWSDASREAGTHSLQQLWSLDYYINEMLVLQGREEEASARLADLAARGSAGAVFLLQKDSRSDKDKHKN